MIVPIPAEIKLASFWNLFLQREDSLLLLFYYLSQKLRMLYRKLCQEALYFVTKRRNTLGTKYLDIAGYGLTAIIYQFYICTKFTAVFVS